VDKETMKIHLNRIEVMKAIEDFLNHQDGEWDWDDFISIPLDDPELEAVRMECLHLPDKFPPALKNEFCNKKGIERLAEIFQGLRQREK
jgi:hypothetical protein